MSENAKQQAGSPRGDRSGRRPPPSQPDVVVVGGGLAGLTAAAIVARAGKSVVVREKRGVVGGQARSATSEGFTFNQGPHALYRAGPAERILTELGVVVRGGKPPVKGWLVFDGQLEIAPAGPISLLRTRALGPKGKVAVARVLARLPKLRASDYATISVEQWIAQIVGEARQADMLRALVRLATYTHQPDQLSAEVAITQLQRALGDGVIYLHGGWQTLVDELRMQPGVHVVTGDGVDSLPDAPAVIITTGGPQRAGELLGRCFDVGPSAAASCLDLGLRRCPDSGVVIGGDVPFYFSNHSAVANLAPAGQYHAAAVQYLGRDDEPDTDAIDAFTRLAGVRDDDVVTSRRLHRMTTVTAIATADRGGLAGRPSVTDTGYPNVFVAGDWVGPTGHLADASVASAQAAADAALAVLGVRVKA